MVDFGKVLSYCVLCPRQCGVNRVAGGRGFCKAGKEAEIFRYAPHYGEEPPLSGTRGSGTIFFSRCTLKCLYCQNYPWSQEAAGEKYSVESLAAIMCQLRDHGCHNWNLVSPTPWLPMIMEALKKVEEKGKLLPVVYNTSGYEREEILETLRGKITVYLPDLRYAREETAAEGSGADNYVRYSRAALKEMWRQVGALKLDNNGVAVSGLICRILILPELAEEACLNIRWLAENIGTDVTLSIMSQYTPAYKATATEPWNRRITHEEYRQVCDQAKLCGFSSGWIQDYNNQLNSDLIGYNMHPVSFHHQEKTHLNSFLHCHSRSNRESRSRKLFAGFLLSRE
jgi:putative pyruvate formate lyase activating enzyme